MPLYKSKSKGRNLFRTSGGYGSGEGSASAGTTLEDIQSQQVEVEGNARKRAKTSEHGTGITTTAENRKSSNASTSSRGSKGKNAAPPKMKPREEEELMIVDQDQDDNNEGDCVLFEASPEPPPPSRPVSSRSRTSDVEGGPVAGKGSLQKESRRRTTSVLDNDLEPQVPKSNGIPSKNRPSATITHEGSRSSNPAKKTLDPKTSRRRTISSDSDDDALEPPVASKLNSNTNTNTSKQKSVAPRSPVDSRSNNKSAEQRLEKKKSSLEKGQPSTAATISHSNKQVPEIVLKPRSAVIEDDSSNDSTDQGSRRGDYVGGRISTGREPRPSASLLDSDEEDDCVSLVETNASTVTPSKSFRSRSRTSCRSSGSVFSTSTTSTVKEKERYDMNDEDWLKFTEAVKRSPASAHEQLTSDILEAGNGTTNCSALLGKLICRAVSGQVDEAMTVETREFHKKCAATIIRTVLHLAIRNDNNSSILVDLVNMLFTELRHFPTSVLYSTVESCITYMKDDKDRDGSLPPRWIEIFGKIVSVLVNKGDIKHETDVIDGQAYKEHIVNEICRLKWTTESTASLIAVLREIPGIEDTELKLIICQLQSCVQEIKASAFPPVVHQMILLAGKRYPSVLLSIAADYFRADNAVTPLEVRRKQSALGTVVFHFLEAARHCDLLLKAVIQIVKASFFDFGQVMSPFTLSVVLGLTTYDHAKAAIVDPLRNSIMKTFQSIHLNGMSYWYKQTAGSSEDTVTECFKAVLESKSAELEFMYNGIKELGTGLLSADPNQKLHPSTIEKCQKLGMYLITSICKGNDVQLPNMMKQLLKVSSKSIVHTECLANCLEMRTRQIIHSSVVGRTCEIIRCLPMMETDAASLIAKALSTALQLSYLLLDQLMLILRKTIWKTVNARRTAARIMIILLSNAKVVGEIPNSQYSESQRISDSQNQAQVPEQLSDNQPLCLELLALTKRCFDQQREVREELYLGFHNVVRRNPGICELICCQLHKHCKQYLSEDDDPVIELKKLVEFPENDIFNSVIVKDELGFMVQCMSHIVRKSCQAFAGIEDGPPVAVRHIEDLLGLWIKAALLLTKEGIEIMAGEAVISAGGSRPLDIAYYVQTLFTCQILQTIEALIEYLNHSGDDREAERTVKKLFEKFKDLEPLLQKKKALAANKKGKGEKGKGGNTSKTKAKDKENTSDDAISIADTASQISSSSSSKFKRPDAQRKIVYFHIFNLDSILDMLRKLYRTSVSDKCPLSSVQRSGDEFEKMLLETVKHKLEGFKRNEPIHERNQRRDNVINSFVEIAGVIWSGLCNEDPDNTESESVRPTAEILETRLDVVSAVSEYVCSFHIHSTSCDRLIRLFGDEVSNVSYDEAFPKFFNSWKSLQGWMPSNPEREDDRNLHTYLYDILQSFSKPMSPDSPDLSQAGEVLAWIWNYMTSSTGKGTQQADHDFADSVVSCWLAYHAKSKGFLEQPGTSQHDVISLAKTVRGTIGENELLDESQFTEYDKMWIVNEDTAATILVNILDYIDVILGHMQTLLGKLKFLPVDNDEAGKTGAEIREGCFLMMGQILNVTSNLAACSFPAGIYSVTILKVLPQIFNVMTGFGEHLFELSKKKADYSLIKGFIGPVNFIGKKFKDLIGNTIQHIENVQRMAAKDATTKAKAGKKKAIQLPQTVKNQFIQDKKLIPNLVYAMERYDNQIVALSDKLKEHRGVKLLAGMKITSARDFKVDEAKFREALRANNARSVQDMTSIRDDDDGTAQPGTSRSRKGKKRKKANAEEAEEAEGEGHDD